MYMYAVDNIGWYQRSVVFAGITARCRSILTLGACDACESCLTAARVLTVGARDACESCLTAARVLTVGARDACESRLTAACVAVHGVDTAAVDARAAGAFVDVCT